VLRYRAACDINPHLQFQMYVFPHDQLQKVESKVAKFGTHNDLDLGILAWL